MGVLEGKEDGGAKDQEEKEKTWKKDEAGESGEMMRQSTRRGEAKFNQSQHQIRMIRDDFAETWKGKNIVLAYFIVKMIKTIFAIPHSSSTLAPLYYESNNAMACIIVG